MRDASSSRIVRVQKCPICQGRGRVPRDFYGETMNNSKEIICQSCHGAGVIEVRRT
jgi:DnaJ-class molecular chaperone